MDKVCEFVEKAYTATPYAPYNRHYNHASKSDTNKSGTDKGNACGIDREKRYYTAYCKGEACCENCNNNA